MFAGINTGGSSTGVAFGPATGSDVVSVRKAAALMSVFALLGGWFVGRNVVKTIGHEFFPPRYFTLSAAVGVLLFTGLGILLGNLREVSVSTSETAVGAVAGLGAALGVLNWETVGVVVSWWLVAPVVAFWVSAVVGRYLYDRIDRFIGWLKEEIDERLGYDVEGVFSVVSKFVVVGIGCYMAFAAGASNVANAVAPLYGAGVIRMAPAILLGAGAMGVGAFAIGPRTMETTGERITDLSTKGALIVEITAATIITLLSQAGIPASLAITTITCVIGLGWGRATKNIPIEESMSFEAKKEDVDAVELFNPQTTRRVMMTWVASPTLAFVLSFVIFRMAVVAGVLGT
ncbi:MAG: anion permease [Halobacteria archaeon]|nr:anion permease [Halobacteria archaeon]